MRHCAGTIKDAKGYHLSTSIMRLPGNVSYWVCQRSPCVLKVSRLIQHQCCKESVSCHDSITRLQTSDPYQTDLQHAQSKHMQ